MNTGPRFARQVDGNHSEIRQLFRDCGAVWLDTSNQGGKLGDGIVQYRDPLTRNYEIKTWLIEVKANKKKKLTELQKKNPLQLTRINCRADVFDLLNQNDWELQ